MRYLIIFLFLISCSSAVRFNNCQYEQQDLVNLIQSDLMLIKIAQETDNQVRINRWRETIIDIFKRFPNTEHKIWGTIEEIKDVDPELCSIILGNKVLDECFTVRHRSNLNNTIGK